MSSSSASGGTQLSSLQTRAEVLKNTFGGDRLHFPFDDLAVTSFRLFDPGVFDIGVGGTIELSYERADQFRFVFAAQRPDLRFDLRYKA